MRPAGTAAKAGRPAATGEQGSGTVLALALIMVLLILLAAVHALTLAATASAQASRGADLAALAGADAARGLAAGDPCAVAESVARRNGVALTSCSVSGRHGTEVLVETAAPILPDQLLPALELPELLSRGAARAGPPPGR